jgi:uncharacterized protein (TIGR03086 family)
MDPAQIVVEAHDAFLQRLDQVTEASLDLDTPCEGWTVTELLQHVTAGCQMVLALLDGASSADLRPIFSASSEIRGSQLIDACRAGVVAARDGLRDLEDPTIVVHFPFGDIPVSRLRQLRVSDLGIHTWDLARAIGADERLPAEVVETATASLEAMGTALPPGMFGEGPSGSLGEGADTQERLLDLSGRRP